MILNKLKPGLELPTYALVKRLELQEQDTYKDMSTSRTKDNQEQYANSLEDTHTGKQQREHLFKLLPIAKKTENSLKLDNCQTEKDKEHALTYTR